MQALSDQPKQLIAKYTELWVCGIRCGILFLVPGCRRLVLTLNRWEQRQHDSRSLHAVVAPLYLLRAGNSTEGAGKRRRRLNRPTSQPTQTSARHQDTGIYYHFSTNYAIRANSPFERVIEAVRRNSLSSNPGHSSLLLMMLAAPPEACSHTAQSVLHS